MIADLLKKLIQLTSLLNSGADLNEALKYIYKSYEGILPYNMIGIVLANPFGSTYNQMCISDDGKECTCVYKDNELSNIKCCGVLEKKVLDQLITWKKVRIIESYEEYLKSNGDSEHTKVLLKEGYKSSISIPIVANDICYGVLKFLSKKDNAFNHNHIVIAKIIANCLSLSIEKSFLIEELVLTSIMGFVKLVEARDNDTGEHVERMQNYSRIIAKSLMNMGKYKETITNDFIGDVYKFSPLHDIGKIAIPDSILLKPGKLTEEEFKVMKTHTTIGANILKNASESLSRKGKDFFKMAIDIALYHHEKFDGTGYPMGMRGSDIPISARIVAVADVLDALSSKRVYKKAYDIFDSMKIIVNQKGTSFDPIVIDALMDSVKEVVNVYEQYNN